MSFEGMWKIPPRVGSMWFVFEFYRGCKNVDLSLRKDFGLENFEQS